MFPPQIIHYMYFHAVSLSPTTVQDILSIAHYLQIENLTETCVEFVRERIDKRNAVSVYLYTSLTCQIGTTCMGP